MDKDDSGEKPKDETATSQFPSEAISPSPEKSIENIPGKSFTGDKRIFKFKMPEKPSPLPLIVIAGILVLGFLVITLYQLIRSHQNSLFLKKIAESKIQGPVNRDYKESSRDIPAKARREGMKTHLFSDDVFYGEAPLKVNSRGAVVSDKADPMLVALGDALNIRIRMLFGIRVKKIGDRVMETSFGDFAGFKISSLVTQPPHPMTGEEISVITPSGGLFKIKNKILESLTRSSYDQVLLDLKKSGIEAISTVDPEKNSIRMNLKIAGLQSGYIGGDFLITGRGVGQIRLGTPVQEMVAELSKKHRILKRKIMVGKKFFTIYKIDDRSGIPLLYVYEKDNRVWGIQIVQEKFLTGKGIGIGASIAAIRICYTNIKIASVPGILNFIFVDQLDQKNIRFILADDNRVYFEKEVFPFDIKIQSILIGKSPYLN